MDRRRRRAALLGLILVGGVAGAQAPETPLRAARWATPQEAAARILSRSPTECLVPPGDPDAALSIEVGRAAFRDPLLLGGQAGRAGLSCESCHREGRGNPHFHFPGVSGPPGTADVTASLFSTHRGNGVDDPKPIPDLSSPKAALKVSQAQGDPALEAFIRGLIVEEFDGRAPPAAVLSGLTAYVRALDPAACPATADDAVTLDHVFNDVRRGAVAAERLLGKGDAAATAAALGSVRSQLRLIDERYAGPALASQRARLRNADRDLAAIAEGVRTGRPNAPRRLARWLRRLPALKADLAPAEPLSLFNPERLEEALKRRLPS